MGLEINQLVPAHHGNVCNFSGVQFSFQRMCCQTGNSGKTNGRQDPERKGKDGMEQLHENRAVWRILSMGGKDLFLERHLPGHIKDIETVEESYGYKCAVMYTTRGFFRQCIETFKTRKEAFIKWIDEFEKKNNFRCSIDYINLKASCPGYDTLQLPRRRSGNLGNESEPVKFSALVIKEF